MTEEEILDAADALGHAGCGIASIREHAIGMELLFINGLGAYSEPHAVI